MENANTKGLDLGESCVVSHLTEEELEESFFEYLTRYLVPRFLAKTEYSEVMKEELTEGMCSQIELADGYGELELIFAPMLLKLKKDTIRTIQDNYDMYKEAGVFTEEFLEEFEDEKLLYCDVDNLYPDTECLNNEWLWENGFGEAEVDEDEEDGEENADCGEDEDAWDYQDLCDLFVDNLPFVLRKCLDKLENNEPENRAIRFGWGDVNKSWFGNMKLTNKDLFVAVNRSLSDLTFNLKKPGYFSIIRVFDSVSWSADFVDIQLVFSEKFMKDIYSIEGSDGVIKMLMGAECVIGDDDQKDDDQKGDDQKVGFDYSNRYYIDKISELTGVKFEQVAYAESAGNAVVYYFYCKRETAEILKSKAADIKQMVEELEGCTITVTVFDSGIETDPAVLVLTLVLD